MTPSRQERELAGRASKNESLPRKRIMLRLFSEGQSYPEIAESLLKQGLLQRGDEKQVAEEIKSCLMRQKVRDKQSARTSGWYDSASATQSGEP